MLNLAMAFAPAFKFTKVKPRNSYSTTKTAKSQIIAAKFYSKLCGTNIFCDIHQHIQPPHHENQL